MRLVVLKAFAVRFATARNRLLACIARSKSSVSSDREKNPQTAAFFCLTWMLIVVSLLVDNHHLLQHVNAHGILKKLHEQYQ